MSTLTYTQLAPLLRPRRRPRRRRASHSGAGFLTALIESQQRRADREIARFIASHGGLLTDDMEREIMRRLTQSDRKVV